MKFFTKEVKIALTTIAAVCLCYYLINFLKGINIFKSSNTYYVQCESIDGLTVNNNVYSNGFSVGLVREINYDYNSPNKVVVAIALNKDMRIPKGTHAELVSALLGGVTMNLILGPNPSDLVHQGDTILGRPHFGAVARAQKALPDVVALVPKLDSILRRLDLLLESPKVSEMLDDAASSMKNVKESTQQLNKMMQNDIPVLVSNLKQSSENFNQFSAQLSSLDVNNTMQQVDATLANVKEFATNMNEMTNHLNQQLSSTDNTMGLLLNDKRVYQHLNATLEHADSLLIDVKAHPKRYVNFSVFGGRKK